MDKRAIPYELTLYALVFAVGIGLSVTLYRNSGALQEETVAYLDKGIAVYAGIAAVRGLQATQESILLLCDRPTERGVFGTLWVGIQRSINTRWTDISR
jgi:hypothetical protein